MYAAGEYIVRGHNCEEQRRRADTLIEHIYNGTDVEEAVERLAEVDEAEYSLIPAFTDSNGVQCFDSSYYTRITDALLHAARNNPQTIQLFSHYDEQQIDDLVPIVVGATQSGEPSIVHSNFGDDSVTREDMIGFLGNITIFSDYESAALAALDALERIGDHTSVISTLFYIANDYYHESPAVMSRISAILRRRAHADELRHEIAYGDALHYGNERHVDASADMLIGALRAVDPEGAVDFLHAVVEGRIRGEYEGPGYINIPYNAGLHRWNQAAVARYLARNNL